MHPPEGAKGGPSNATLEDRVIALVKKWRDAEKVFGRSSPKEYRARQELRKYADKLP